MYLTTSLKSKTTSSMVKIVHALFIEKERQGHSAERNPELHKILDDWSTSRCSRRYGKRGLGLWLDLNLVKIRRLVAPVMVREEPCRVPQREEKSIPKRRKRTSEKRESLYKQRQKTFFQRKPLKHTRMWIESFKIPQLRISQDPSWT